MTASSKRTVHYTKYSWGRTSNPQGAVPCLTAEGEKGRITRTHTQAHAHTHTHTHTEAHACMHTHPHEHALIWYIADPIRWGLSIRDYIPTGAYNL